MKIVSWNLNGLQACLKSQCFEPVAEIAPDILCLQEIRTQEEPEILPGYYHYWNHSEREGYSGTALLCHEKPIRLMYGLGSDDSDEEGRSITVEYPEFFLINAYVPNSQRNLQRHDYRRVWDEHLRNYAQSLLEYKPVIITGDFNVAREDIDIYPENLRQYWASQGFASDERSDLETLIELGFQDTFRTLYPDVRSYTWWSNRLRKREQNRGWRLDYFLVDDNLMPFVRDVAHLADIMGSDHCPILLEVNL